MLTARPASDSWPRPTPGVSPSWRTREGTASADHRRVGGWTAPVASIGQGLVLLGVGHDDDAGTPDALAERVAQPDLPRRGGPHEPVADRRAR